MSSGTQPLPYWITGLALPLAVTLIGTFAGVFAGHSCAARQIEDNRRMAFARTLRAKAPHRESTSE